jgi:hypothetical protein
MDYGKLIEAVKLCGSTPKIDQCKKCAYYAGGDMNKCIPVMTNDAANALSALQIDLASMRGAANSYKAENEKLRVESEQRSADNWISVEERLPESDLPKNSTKLQIKVLVAIRAKNGYTVRTQNRIRQEKSWMSGGGFTDWYWRYSAGEVTHWMPIPQSPKEAKK